jgi:hypothetical protein
MESKDEPRLGRRDLIAAGGILAAGVVVVAVELTPVRAWAAPVVKAAVRVPQAAASVIGYAGFVAWSDWVLEAGVHTATVTVTNTGSLDWDESLVAIRQGFRNAEPFHVDWTITVNSLWRDISRAGTNYPGYDIKGFANTETFRAGWSSEFTVSLTSDLVEDNILAAALQFPDPSNHPNGGVEDIQAETIVYGPVG